MKEHRAEEERYAAILDGQPVARCSFTRASVRADNSAMLSRCSFMDCSTPGAQDFEVTDVTETFPVLDDGPIVFNVLERQ